MTTLNYDVAYREYLIEVSDARDNVSFLLDNLGVDCALAFDVESLEKAEAAYWNFLAEGESPELTDEDHFAQLLGQFLAQTVEETLGVSLSQCPDSGQPVICGFGEFEGREIYPVRIAAMLKSLPD